MPLYPPSGGAGGAAISAGTQSQNTGTVVFSNSNGVSFGLSNGVMTATVTPGAAAGIAAVTAGTQQQTIGTLQFVNSNGISIGMSNSSQLTFSHNGLTTAMASNRGSDFMGTATALTANGVAVTANSAGLSLNFPAFLTTAQPTGAYLTTARASNDAIGLNSALTANGVSVTANSSGLSLNFPAFLTTAQPVGAYLTTARASNDAIGLNTALTANGVSVTANSSGLSLNFPAFLTTAQAPGAYLTTARASNDAIGLNSALTANGVSVTANSSGLSLNFPAFLTTAALSADSSKYAGTTSGFAGTNISGSITMNTLGINLALSVAAPGAGGGIGIAAGTRTATTAGTLLFDTGNGITFGLNAVGGSIMTASHNALTVQSVQAMNMYAVSNTTGASSSSTMDARSISFQGAGVVSVGFTNGSVVISANAAAGDGVNIVSMLTSTSGGGTAGATFSNSAASIGLMAGSNITLSQTSNTIVFNAPASSSLVGASGISISTNGSTISVYQAALSFWANELYLPNSQSQTVGQSTSVVFPFHMDGNVSAGFMGMLKTVSLASTSFASTGNTSYSYNMAETHNFVIYSRGVGASSMSLQSVMSTSVGLTFSIQCSQNTTNNISVTHGLTYPVSNGTNSVSFSYAATNSTMQVSTSHMTALSGMKIWEQQWATQITMGRYWMAHGISTNQTTQQTAILSGARLVHSHWGVSAPNNTFGFFGSANNASVMFLSGVGSFSTTAIATTASLGFSNVSSSASHVIPYILFVRVA